MPIGHEMASGAPFHAVNVVYISRSPREHTQRCMEKPSPESPSPSEQLDLMRLLSEQPAASQREISARLGLSLGPFSLRGGIPCHASADAKAGVAGGAFDFDRADRNIEGRAPPRSDPADRAGINTPRGGFKIGDDLHRANFRRAGD